MQRNNKFSWLKILSIMVLACLLQGCMNAAVSSAQAVYDRHNLQNSLRDRYIILMAERKIYLDTPQFNNTNVSVTSFNGIVLITGQVPKPTQRVEIEAIVKQIHGVHEIHNLLTIAGPSSSLTRVSDSWITAKIKTHLIAMKDIDPSQIKVVTDNGVVYLMGIIPHAQADIAVDIARSTEGVREVVRMFYYVSISKT